MAAQYLGYARKVEHLPFSRVTHRLDESRRLSLLGVRTCT